MKLSTKLILSFSVVILLVGGIGVTSSYIYESVKDQVTAESRQAIEEVDLAGEMGLQLYRSLTRTQYLLEDRYRQSLSSTFSKGGLSNEVVVKRIEEALKSFQQSINQTRELIKKDNPQLTQDTTDSTNVIILLNELDKKFSIYSSLIEQLRKLSTESYQDGKEFFTVTIEPYFRTNMLPLIERVRDNIQANHQQKIATLNSQLVWVGQILGIATVLALVIAISLTFFLYRSIANPLNKIARAAQNIGKGNLSDRIDYQSNDELGQLSETFNHMAESLSRTTVSRDYVDSIIESMADLLIVTDEEFKITRVNSAGVLMLKMSEENLLDKQADTIFKNGSSEVLSGDTNHQAEKIKSKNEILLVNDGSEIPVSVSQGTIRGREGDIEGYVIVASDISSEKQAREKIAQSLKEKEVLLAEIHHRVKNNLAVISGLLQMQIWEAENEYAVTALQESQLRVRSIALVHEKLYQSESLSYIQFDTYILDLLRAISDTYLTDESPIEIITELEEVILNINQAIPCSLLLNELVVNAFKHAFKDNQEGAIKVCMEKSDNEVTLVVKDNGEGFPDLESTTETLGMSLIDTLSEQLGGKLRFNNNNGAEITTTFEAETEEDISFSSDSETTSRSTTTDDDSRLW